MTQPVVREVERAARPDASPELLRRLKQKDAEAQRELWCGERPRILAICIRILGPGADADEVADGVIIDFLFDAVLRLEEPRALRSYLTLMATRRSLRRRDRRRDLVDETPQQSAGSSAERDAEAALLLPRLPDCISVLTPKAQTALSLRFREELTTEHIGQILGTSKQYIGRLITKSLAALRVCLERGKGDPK